MLIENFYQVISLQEIANQNYSAQITLNAQHAIFKGHFPDNPVMPGICMIQIIKELTEGVLKQALFMEQVSNVKFMSLINPEKCNELLISFVVDQSSGKVKVKSNIEYQGGVALKMSSTYSAK